jgi:hypothetical protein
MVLNNHVQLHVESHGRLRKEVSELKQLVGELEYQASCYRYIRDASPEERSRLEHYSSDALDAILAKVLKDS